MNINDKVIVRCRDAGVWFGEYQGHNGREVKVANGRRMWYWKPAAGMSLSGCAISGVHNDSKIAGPVSEVTLLEACEIMLCSQEGGNSIANATIWNK